MTGKNYVMVPVEDYDQVLQLLAAVPGPQGTISEALRLLQRGARRDFSLQLQALSTQVLRLNTVVFGLQKALKTNQDDQIPGDPGLDWRG